MENFDRARPREGWEGMVPECVRRVRVVLKPDMYWERSSRPWARPREPLGVEGSQREVIGMLLLLPGRIERLTAVAWPIWVPFDRRTMLTKGTVAE